MKFRVVTGVDNSLQAMFGGNQLAVLPDATGISTGGMQKIAREFNFGETTFVLPKNDPGNTYRVRIFAPRTETLLCGASLGRHSLCACDETARTA